MQGRIPVPSLNREFLPVIEAEVRRSENSLAPISESESDREEMRQCFIGMAALFPMQDIGEEGFTIKASILSEIFDKYPLFALKEACVDFAKTGEWFPRPKELIERIESIIGRKQVKIKRLLELKGKIA